jgi:hypothetical protein
VRSVGEYFLKYLISRPGVKADDAAAIAEGLYLPTISDEYIKKLESSLEPYPDDYEPTSDTHIPTLAYLREHRIKDMWRRTPGAKQAFKIIDMPNIREYVESAIISPLPLQEFVDDLPRGIELAGLKTYKHYFYNTDLLDGTQLETALLKKGGLRLVAKEGDTDLIKRLFNHSMGTESFSMPMSHLSKKMMDIAAVKLLKLSRTEPSKDDATMMQKYAMTIQQAQDILASSGAAAEDLVDLFAKLSVRSSDETKLPTYLELTGKEHEAHGKDSGGST